MANFQTKEPPTRWLVGLGAAGKAIEVSLTEMWAEFGVLLSPPPSEPIQLGAEDPDSWLTCSFDSVLLPLGTKRPVPVEVKSKALDKVREMIMGNRGPDEQHLAQLKVQLYFLEKHQAKWWPDLEPVQFGVLYYLSRDDPSVNKEFVVPLDKEWVEERLEILKSWRDDFLSGELVSTHTKSHPLGWKWSEGPCKFCEYKRDICKPDFKAGITDLGASHGIKYTTEKRAEYDYGKARKAVEERWSQKT